MGTVMHSNASNNIAVSPVAVVCNCSADANPLPIKYQFYSNDNLLGESFDGIYVISETRQYHGGIIKCVPRNMLGNGEEAFLNFTVNGKILIQSFQFITICFKKNQYACIS